MAITRSRSRSLHEAQTGSSNSKKRRRTASSNSRKKQRTGARGNSRKKPKMSGSDREWKALPQGPLSLISEQLQSEIDVVRFRSVCTSWRSAAPRRQSPWFLAHSRDPSEISVRSKFSGALFSLSLALIPETPIVFTSTYCSSYGWLADLFYSPQEKIITLFNPITGDHIVLPVVTGLSPMDYGGMRLILSSNPAATSDYTVAILCDAKLATYTPRDEAWSLTEFPKRLYKTDVAFYRGLIYVAGTNRIFVFDPAAKEKCKFVRATPIPCVDGKLSSDECCLSRYGKRNFCGGLYLSSYLVESCGDLLLVRKRINFWNGDRRCEIFQLQFCGRRLRGTVKKMESLGDHRALFLGRGCSFSLSVTMFPEYKGNHIYFVNEGDGCICVFSVADGEVERVTLEPQCWAPNDWFRPHLL